MRRLLKATRPLPSVVLDRYREEEERLATSCHLLYVSVLGSIARGHAFERHRPLITPDEEASLLDMAGFMLDVEKVTGCEDPEWQSCGHRRSADTQGTILHRRSRCIVRAGRRCARRRVGCRSRSSSPCVKGSGLGSEVRLRIAGRDRKVYYAALLERV